MREADYPASPSLAEVQPLPAAPGPGSADIHTAQAAWSDALGGAPVVLLADVGRARALLLRALGVRRGAPLGLPANATRDLAEMVKHHPAVPRWLDLGPELALPAAPDQLDGVRAVWAQPCGGAWATSAPGGVALLTDASDSLPLPGHPPDTQSAATIFGLHLSADQRRAGALVVCRDPATAHALGALAGPADRPDPALALAQLQRLTAPGGLAERQQAALAAVRQGLTQAAGLPLLAPTPGALAQQIAVRVPEPCDAATFYAYVLGEQTPVRWLPALRPLHYAAIRADGAPHSAATGAHLARTLLVPVGPGYTAEEILHAVLGITKAADYLGVRWAADPARAAWYAALMVEWYGADHDAFRPLAASVAA